MSVKFFFQNTKQITHCSHASYCSNPSFAALLEKRRCWVFSLKKRKEEEAELMPDQNSSGDKVKFGCAILFKPRHGLFLK